MKKTSIILIILLFTAASPEISRAREFLNSIMHINMGYLFSFAPQGAFISEEESLYEIEQEDGAVKSPTHKHTGLAFNVDLMFIKPFILGTDSHAFKLGIRAGIKYHSVDQEMIYTAAGGSKEDHGGQLMSYYDWMVGPVIYYAPSFDFAGFRGNLTAGGGFTAYVLAGRIFNGSLTAYPAMRSDGVFSGAYEADLSGLRIDAGIGAALSVCSVNLGFNLYYSRTSFETGDNIYSSSGRKAVSNEVCAEVYMGIPIESMVETDFYKGNW